VCGQKTLGLLDFGVGLPLILGRNTLPTGVKFDHKMKIELQV
jgi:hypothetical protein